MKTRSNQDSLLNNDIQLFSLNISTTDHTTLYYNVIKHFTDEYLRLAAAKWLRVAEIFKKIYRIQCIIIYRLLAK